MSSLGLGLQFQGAAGCRLPPSRQSSMVESEHDRQGIEVIGFSTMSFFMGP